MDENGKSLPCTFEKHGVRSRYFSAQVYLDPERYEKTDNQWLSELNAVLGEHGGNPFFPGKAAGWRRPYEISPEESILPIRHPLYALSSFGFPDESAEGLSIRDISSALLAFLMQPLVKFVLAQGFDPREVNVAAITPAYLSRPARGILCGILRKTAFRRIFIFSHAIALAMNYLRSEHKAVGVIHADENCLHVSKVRIERKQGKITLGCMASQSTGALGWNAIIRKLTHDFCADNIPDGHLQAYLNRALLGLFGGVFSADVPARQNLRLTYAMLEEKLNGRLGQCIRNEAAETLIPILKELKLRKRTQLICAGLFFMSGKFESLILDAVKKNQLFHVRRIPAPERAAYGVALMLNWLGENPGQDIRIRNNYAVRISATPGNTVELIPSSLFPLEPGKRRIVRHVLNLEAEENMTDELLLVDILWGNHPTPRYNSSLCTMTCEMNAGDIRKGSRLELIFDLRGISGGLRGEVTARLEGRESQRKKLHFPDMGHIFTRDAL